MIRARVSVVKIGGSLLTAAAFPKRLRAWLKEKMDANRDTHFVLIVGGGKWADAIRDVDAHAPLGDERAHWICIAIMDITAGLVGAMIPELSATSSLAELEYRLMTPGVTLLHAGAFLREFEPTLTGVRLPANWSVTSDSIAGRLAIVLRADELALLKSSPPPVPYASDDWLRELAAVGYVDAFFPMLGGELPPLKIIGLPVGDGL